MLSLSVQLGKPYYTATINYCCYKDSLGLNKIYFQIFARSNRSNESVLSNGWNFQKKRNLLIVGLRKKKITCSAKAGVFWY